MTSYKAATIKAKPPLLGVALIGVFACTASAAQSLDDQSGIVRGPVTFLPAASAALRYDDNLYESDDYKRDSWVSLFGVGMGLRYETPDSGWELAYAGEGGVYQRNSNDNYFDHRLNARSVMQLGVRSRLQLDAGLEKLHEDRGTNLTQGFGASLEELVPRPYQYDRHRVAVRYQYGAQGAKGRFVLDARYSDQQYTNNRDRTRFFDSERPYVSGMFLWQFLPKSSLLLQGTHSIVSYPVDFVGQTTRDSTTNRLLGGVTWEATAKTTGTVKLGYLNKDFDAADRPTFRAPSWEVELRWEPRTYSVFEFETSRYDREFNFGFGGDFIDTIQYGATWKHQWSTKWSTESSASYFDETFENSSETSVNRTQQTLQFDAALRFAMFRGLDLEMRYVLRNRDANVDRFLFSRNQFQLGLSLKL